MSASPTTYTKRIALAIACTVALPAFTGVAVASPTITKVDGNPTCASVGAGQELFKAEPVTSKSFSRGSFSGQLTVKNRVFDFTTNKPVDVVIVKGGDNANVYRYTPETTSGSGLHAPINPNNGEFYGLSHVSFCQDNAPPPPPPPPCTPGGSDTKADGTPCTPPPPPPCTEGGSDMKADGTPCTPPPPPPPPPCTEGGSDMKDDGTPCNPPPCTPGGSDMKADGTPCTPPPPPPPCTEGDSDMKADGTPCNPGPPVTTVVPSIAPKKSGVLGVVGQLAAANASMRSPRRCVSRSYTQVFQGRGIRRITVRVNGRVVRTLRGAGTVRIDPRRYGRGVMRIQARVEYVASSRRRPQTLRATVLRCALQQSGPQFTG